MRPPCKRDGFECINRHVGCQPQCPDYLLYRWEQDKHNNELKPGREAMNALCSSKRAVASIKYKNKFRR